MIHPPRVIRLRPQKQCILARTVGKGGRSAYQRLHSFTSNLEESLMDPWLTLFWYILTRATAGLRRLSIYVGLFAQGKLLWTFVVRVLIRWHRDSFERADIRFWGFCCVLLECVRMHRLSSRKSKLAVAAVNNQQSRYNYNSAPYLVLNVHSQ